MKQCPYCHTANLETSTYCTHCGKPLNVPKSHSFILVMIICSMCLLTLGYFMYPKHVDTSILGTYTSDVTTLTITQTEISYTKDDSTYSTPLLTTLQPETLYQIDLTNDHGTTISVDMIVYEHTAHVFLPTSSTFLHHDVLKK